MDKYEKYEEECRKIQTENSPLLFEFRGWLKAKGISNKTIETHVNNVDFFINTYLLHREALRAKEGVWEISFYQVNWFIRKALWSSVAKIKSNAASFKKFYKFMHEKGEIDDEALEEVNWLAKEEMAEWIDGNGKIRNSGRLRRFIWAVMLCFLRSI